MGSFVLNVFAGTGITVASQYMGARQHSWVGSIYLVNLLGVGILAVGYSGLLLAVGEQVPKLLGMPVELWPIAASYLNTIAAYYPPLAVVAACNAVLASQGRTRWIMYTSCCTAATNVAAAYMFVVILGQGATGLARAAVCSIAIAMAISIAVVRRTVTLGKPSRETFRRMRSVLGVMTRLGVSNVLEPFSYSCQQGVVSTFVVAMGVTAMAATSYASRCQSLQVTFAFALASGAQILAAHGMGAGRSEDVERLFWRTLGIAVGVSAAYSVALWQGASAFLAIFTNDAAVRRTAEGLLAVSIVTEPARAVNIVSSITLKAVGDVRFPLVLSMVFIWGLLPVIYVLDSTKGLSLVGLWMCFAADEVLRAVINIVRWRRGAWRLKTIIRHRQPDDRSCVTV
jgi:Na+-driven multidrug efflux pump